MYYGGIRGRGRGRGDLDCGGGKGRGNQLVAWLCNNTYLPIINKGTPNQQENKCKKTVLI